MFAAVLLAFTATGTAWRTAVADPLAPPKHREGRRDRSREVDLGDGSGGYAGDTSFVTSVTSTNIACVTAAPTDAIETVVSGGTSLRWDDVTNQFIFNWKTPKTPGACLLLTVTLTDGTTHSASFKADVAKSRRSLAK